MQLPNLCNPHTVFSKTAKGRKAVVQYPGGLTARERRVLMAIDEATHLDLIVDDLPRRELSRTVSVLLQEGLIASEIAAGNFFPGENSDWSLAGNVARKLSARQAPIPRNRRDEKQAKIARLKNPEIFTPGCCGGFASAALVVAQGE